MEDFIKYYQYWHELISTEFKIVGSAAFIMEIKLNMYLCLLKIYKRSENKCL